VVSEAPLLTDEQPAAAVTDLSDAQWRRLSRVIKQNPPNRRPYDRRRAANAIAWNLTPGRRWEDLPPRFGSAPAAKRRYQIWKRDGTLANVATVIHGRHD